eukprot:7589595-Prorocentrum_lima.AAC.1
MVNGALGNCDQYVVATWTRSCSSASCHSDVHAWRCAQRPLGVDQTLRRKRSLRLVARACSEMT